MKTLFKKIYKTFSFLNFFIASLITIFTIVLLIFSPIVATVWVLLLTLHLLRKNQYKLVIYIWIAFLFFWYVVFTLCLLGYDDPIWIGGENTLKLIIYFTIRQSEYILTPFWYLCYFQGFCFQTLIMLDMLSSLLGVNIYVPSLVKVLVIIFKFITKD